MTGETQLQLFDHIPCKKQKNLRKKQGKGQLLRNSSCRLWGSGLFGLHLVLRETPETLSFPRELITWLELTIAKRWSYTMPETDILAVLIDSVNSNLALPDINLQNLRELFHTWSAQDPPKRTTKPQHQEVIEKLAWAGRVIKGGRIPVSQLIDLMCSIKDNHFLLTALTVMALRTIWQNYTSFGSYPKAFLQSLCVCSIWIHWTFFPTWRVLLRLEAGHPNYTIQSWGWWVFRHLEERDGHWHSPYPNSHFLFLPLLAILVWSGSCAAFMSRILQTNLRSPQTTLLSWERTVSDQ